MNIKDITKVIKNLKNMSNLPISAYGQGDGLPADDEGWKFKNTSAVDNYIHESTKWIANGISIIGGCCGTNPTYIKKLTKKFSQAN